MSKLTELAEALRVLDSIDTSPNRWSSVMGPEFVETEEEYAALPEGSVVAAGFGTPYIKQDRRSWYEAGIAGGQSNASMPPIRRRVIRRGWGNE